VRDQASPAGVLTSWLHRSYVDRFRLGLLGPAPFLAAVALVTLGPPARAALLPALFAAGLAALWALTVPAFRFYVAGLALLPLLLPPASRSRAWRACLWGCVAVNAVWLPHVVHHVDRPWNEARGELSAARQVASRLANGAQDAAEYLRRADAPGPGARTLAVGEVRTYLAAPWTITPSYFEPSPFLSLAAASRDGDRLYVRLRQLGVRRLLVNVPEMIRLRLWEGLCWDAAMPANILEEFFRRHARLEYARGAGWVYELSAATARWAVVPECFTTPRDGAARAGFQCVTLLQRDLAAGDAPRALARGYAAVTAQPHSGLAWSALGDALYASGKWEHAVGAYSTALALGWRTSATYRNHGVALSKIGKGAAGQQSLLYANRLDPLSPRLRNDLQAVYLDWLRELKSPAEPR
jgi:tetratricopeptide (TPR) repeat protein